MAASELALKPNVVFTVLDQGEAVLLDLDTKFYFSLNESGARIIQLLEAGRTREEILTTLQAEYEVAPEPLSRLLDGFFQQLLREGIVNART